MSEHVTSIRAYKMTTANGFAPNIYDGILTLATCKPGIRRCARVGEWIAGFTSSKMNGDCKGQERLVFLMQVQQAMSIAEYWDNYPQKRPHGSSLADNIYCLPEQAKAAGFSYIPIYCDNPLGFVRVEPVNQHSEQSLMTKDIRPNRVLISKEYRYFGQDNPLRLETSIRKLINLPEGQHPFGYITRGKPAEDFISYVMGVQ